MYTAVPNKRKAKCRNLINSDTKLYSLDIRSSLIVRNTSFVAVLIMFDFANVIDFFFSKADDTCYNCMYVRSTTIFYDYVHF